MAGVNIVVQTVDKSTGTLKNISSAVREIGSSAQSAVKTGVSPLTIALGTGLYDVSRKLAGGLTSMVGNVVQTGIQFNNLKQQADIAFTTMLGSGEKAAAFMKDLQKFAASTPFEFPDLIQASQRLMAMGFSAEKVKPMLTAVGDAVAALGGGSEKIDRVTMALGQMQAKGKVSAEEMLQLTEAGIPAWELLANKIGVSIPEAQEKAKKGAIDTNTAITGIVDGLSERFGGMMDAQSKTWGGMVSTLSDSFTQLSGTVMQPFFDLGTQGLGNLLDILNSPMFLGWADALAAAITTYVMPALEQITAWIEWLGYGMTIGDNPVDALRIALINMVPDETTEKVMGVITKIGELWQAISDGIHWLADIVFDVGKAAAEFVTWKDILVVLGGIIASTLIPMLAGIVSAIAPVVLGVSGLVMAVATLRTAWENDLGGIRSFVGEFWDFLVTNFAGVAEQWRIFGGALIGNLNELATEILNFITGSGEDFDTFKRVFDMLEYSLRVTWNKIIEVIEENWPIWRGIFEKYAQAAWTWIKDTALPKVAEWLETLWGSLRAWASDHLPAWANVLLDWGEKAWKWIADAAPKALEWVRKTFDGVVGFIKGSVFSGWVQTLTGWYEQVRQWFEVRIPPVIEKVKGFMQGIVDFVRGSAFQEWGNRLRGWYESVKDWFQERIPPVLEQLRRTWEDWRDKITGFVKFVQDKFGPFYEELKRNLIPAGKEILEFVTKGKTEFESLGRAWETLKGILVTIWETIQNEVFDPIIDWFKTTLPDASAEFIKLFETMKETWDELAKEFGETFGILNEDLEGHGDTWVRVIDGTIGGLVMTLGTILEQISELIQAALNVWQGDWDGAWENIKNIAELTGENIKGWHDRFSGEMQQKQKDFLNAQVAEIYKGTEDQELAMELLGSSSVASYVSGSESKMQETIDLYKRIGKASAQALRDELDMHSPSQVMFNVGIEVLEGFDLGLWDAAPAVIQTMAQVGTDITSSFSSALQNGASHVEFAMHNLTDKVISAVEFAKEEIEKLMDSLDDVASLDPGQMYAPGSNTPIQTPGNFKDTNQFMKQIGFDNVIKFLSSRALGQYDSEAFTGSDSRLRGGLTALGGNLARTLSGASAASIEAELADIKKYLDATAKGGDYLNDFIVDVMGSLKDDVLYVGQMLATTRGKFFATDPAKPEEEKPAEEVIPPSYLDTLLSGYQTSPQAKEIFNDLFGFFSQAGIDITTKLKDLMKGFSFQAVTDIGAAIDVFEGTSQKISGAAVDFARAFLSYISPGEQNQQNKNYLAQLFGGDFAQAMHLGQADVSTGNRIIQDLRPSVLQIDKLLRSGNKDDLSFAKTLIGNFATYAGGLQYTPIDNAVAGILSNLSSGSTNAAIAKWGNMNFLLDQAQAALPSIFGGGFPTIDPAIAQAIGAMKVTTNNGQTSTISNSAYSNNVALSALPGIENVWGEFKQNLEGFTDFFYNLIGRPYLGIMAAPGGGVQWQPGAQAISTLEDEEGVTIKGLIGAVFSLVDVIKQKGIKPPLEIVLPERTGNDVTDLINAVNYINALEGVG